MDAPMSRKECRASVNIAREPVIRPAVVFPAIIKTAATIEKRATDLFSFLSRLDIDGTANP